MIFLILFTGVFVLDYVVKQHVNTAWLQGSSRKAVGDRLIFRNCHNEGIAFGLLKKMDARWCQLIAAASLGGVVWESIRTWTHGGRRLAKAGLALILGGGANNLAERIQNGYVTDYLSVNVKKRDIRRLTFNLSDVFIMVGTCFWAAGSVLPHRKNRDSGKRKKR